MKISTRHLWLNLGLSVGIVIGSSGGVQASFLDQTPVGMTYYGGHYDEQGYKWIVDNTYQCDRIKTGELSVESLGATPTKNCDDDPGVGYFDYITLHNTMSFAELSIDPALEDFSALGNLPARTRLQVEYNNKCVVIEKLDVGKGGSAFNGYRRSIDLWWETARSLGFINGFDVARLSYVDQTTPLTPLGQTSKCIVKEYPVPSVLEPHTNPVITEPDQDSSEQKSDDQPTAADESLESSDDADSETFNPLVGVGIGFGAMALVSLAFLIRRFQNRVK